MSRMLRQKLEVAYKKDEFNILKKAVDILEDIRTNVAINSGYDLTYSEILDAIVNKDNYIHYIDVDFYEED